MSESITPQQAREELGLIAHPDDPLRFIDIGIRALETLAAMTTEADYRVVPHEQVEGRYVTRRYERHVTEWEEAPRD